MAGRTLLGAGKGGLPVPVQEAHGACGWADAAAGYPPTAPGPCCADLTCATPYPPPLAFGFQPKSLGGGVAEKMRPRTGRRPLQRVSIDFQPVSLGWKAYSPARGVGRLPLGEGPRRVSSGLRPRRCEQRPRRAHLGPLAGWRRQCPPHFTPLHPPQAAESRQSEAI